MSSAEYVSDLVVREATEEFDSAVEVVLLYQSLKLRHTLAITADNEMNVLELC